MKNICHNFYRTIIFNASALAIDNTGAQLDKALLNASLHINVC